MKKIFITMLTAAVFCMTAACGNVRYNALIYDNAQSEMKKEFLEANLTQNAYYGDGGYAGESCPKSIKHVVKDQETFDGIFAEAWIDIDFEKEMLVLCFFTCYYMGRPYEINKISVDNQALEIKVKSVRPKGCFAYPSIPDASTPMQRCFAVKMDKLDIEEAEFSISD